MTSTTTELTFIPAITADGRVDIFHAIVLHDNLRKLRVAAVAQLKKLPTVKNPTRAFRTSICFLKKKQVTDTRLDRESGELVQTTRPKYAVCHEDEKTGDVVWKWTKRLTNDRAPDRDIRRAESIGITVHALDPPVEGEDTEALAILKVLKQLVIQTLTFAVRARGATPIPIVLIKPKGPEELHEGCWYDRPGQTWHVWYNKTHKGYMMAGSPRDSMAELRRAALHCQEIWDTPTKASTSHATSAKSHSANSVSRHNFQNNFESTLAASSR